MNSYRIVPGLSIGPVFLGDNEATVLTHFGPPKSERGFDMLILEYGNLSVWLRDDAVFTLIAKESWPGSTPHGVTPGMPWLDLVEAVDNVGYDIDMALWFSPDEPGAWYDVVSTGDKNQRPNPRYTPYRPERFEVANPETSFVRWVWVMEGEGTLLEAEWIDPPGPDGPPLLDSP
jgi:hypothetical protein